VSRDRRGAEAMNVAFQRLQTQRLVGPPFPSAVEAVRALVAVQSQDYPAAKWAVGLRLSGATDRALDALCDEGVLLRTHVLRPTWHFVLPEDIHWLLELTAPRIKQAMASYDRKLELDSRVHARAFRVFEKELRDGRYRTRTELADALERSRIPARGQRLGHLMMNAELDGVVVSGPLRGKQSTYALLDERAQRRRRLGRDEALAELALRYFTGHGPAQLQDFSWWSGLSPSDARRAHESVQRQLASEEVEGKTYWTSPAARPARPTPSAHLLPNFDEYFIAYRDRSASVDLSLKLGRSAPFPYGKTLAHVVLVNGVVHGGWKRRPGDGEVAVRFSALAPLPSAARAALRASADRLSAFLEMRVQIVATDSGGSARRR
jgi:hypothetical protein